MRFLTWSQAIMTWSLSPRQQRSIYLLTLTSLHEQIWILIFYFPCMMILGLFELNLWDPINPITPISSIQCHLLKLFLYHQKWKTNFKAGQLSICYIIQRVLKTQARNIVYSFPCSFSRSLSPIGLKARGKEQTELLDIFVHVWLSRGNWWGKIFLYTVGIK
jgi:hypothetical protein